MALQSKMTVYLAIVALLAMIGGFVLYANSGNSELEKVEVELQGVSVVNVDKIKNKADLEIIFLVKNPSDKTLTISHISYQLYGDDKKIGTGQYSTEDIALSGRALFVPGAEIPLKSKFSLSLVDVGNEIYDLVVNDKIKKFDVQGTFTVQTSWSTIDKEFKSGI